MNYRILGHLEQVAPHEFFIIVSTVSENSTADSRVYTAVADSLQSATTRRDQMIREAQNEVTRIGGKISGIEK